MLALNSEDCLVEMGQIFLQLSIYTSVSVSLVSRQFGEPGLFPSAELTELPRKL
jgi:hypothetical protein